MLMYFLILCSVLMCNIVFGDLNKLISKGRWFIDKEDKCPNPEQYKWDVTCRKRKVNRTHDGISADLTTTEPITEYGFGFLIEACKKMDGGCKPFHRYQDYSICQAMEKYAPKNFQSALASLGLEPHCPIPKGAYNLRDFVFDNSEMPQDGIIGSYMATIYITQNFVKIACWVTHATFIAKDDLPDYGDDY